MAGAAGITEDLGPASRTRDGRGSLRVRRRRRADWCSSARATTIVPRVDSKTGKELWSAKLDATANANPMTYQGKDGKQYVAIVAGLTLNVFALP